MDCETTQSTKERLTRLANVFGAVEYIAMFEPLHVIDCLLSKTEELQGQSSKLQMETKELNSQIKDMAQELDEVEAERDKLKEQVARQQREIVFYLLSLNEKMAEIRKLDGEIIRLNQEQSKL